MPKNRRHFSDAFKANVVRRHLTGKVAVSDLAAEQEIQPTQIHLWVKQVLDQAEKAFERSKGPKRKTMEGLATQRIGRLEAKLANTNEVIAELTEENVKAKLQSGALRGRWIPHDTRDQVVDYVGQRIRQRRGATRALNHEPRSETGRLTAAPPLILPSPRLAPTR